MRQLLKRSAVFIAVGLIVVMVVLFFIYLAIDRIDDRRRCENAWCPVFGWCDRTILMRSRSTEER